MSKNQYLKDFTHVVDISWMSDVAVSIVACYRRLLRFPASQVFRTITKSAISSTAYEKSVEDNLENLVDIHQNAIQGRLREIRD